MILHQGRKTMECYRNWSLFVEHVLAQSVSDCFRVSTVLENHSATSSCKLSARVKWRKTNSGAVYVVSLQKRAAWSRLGRCRVLLQHLFKSIQSENSFVNVTAAGCFCQRRTTISFVELGRRTVMKRLSLWSEEKPLKGRRPGYLWLAVVVN